MYSSTQKRLFSISRDFSKLFAETLDKKNTSCFVDTSDDVKLVHYLKKKSGPKEVHGSILPLLLLRKRCFRGSLLAHSLSRYVLRFTRRLSRQYYNRRNTNNGNSNAATRLGRNGFESAVLKCEPPTAIFQRQDVSGSFVLASIWVLLWSSFHS